jgi:hypothetical protein
MPAALVGAPQAAQNRAPFGIVAPHPAQDVIGEVYDWGVVGQYQRVDGHGTTPLRHL